jgi:MFS family permease
MSVQATDSAGVRGGYRYFVVGMLAVVYTFNFLDRQILSILAEPIRKDLNLSDTELGMLTGLTFAVFYTFCGIPIAWLADRSNRVRIITFCCAVWSLFSAACGLAQNFTQLAIARVGVAIGEAGGSPPSYSLISDYFPPKERGKALALYSLGVPIGSMIGAGAGGWLAAEFGWRVAFFVVGLPGLVLSLIAFLTIKEPQRGRLDPIADGAATHEPSPPIAEAIAAFFTNRTLLLTAIAAGMTAFVGYGMLNWNAAYLIRVKGMSLTEIALYFSLILGITGAIGTFMSGWLADRLSRIDRRWYAWIPAIAFAVEIPFFVGFLLAPTWQIAILFVAVPFLMNNVYLAPAIAVVQNAVPPSRRTISGAILLFVLNIIGLGGGPLFVGMISDAAKPAYGENSLMIGLAALIPVIVLTIGAHLLSAMSIGRDKRLSAL